MGNARVLKRELLRFATQIEGIAERRQAPQQRTADALFRYLFHAASISRHLAESRLLSRHAFWYRLNVREQLRVDSVEDSEPVSHSRYRVVFGRGRPTDAMFIANNLVHECYVAVVARKGRRPLEVHITSRENLSQLYAVSVLELAAWFRAAAADHPDDDRDVVEILHWTDAA
jgi:hypothetical protein